MDSTTQLLRIDHRMREWHARYAEFVRLSFSRADFSRWIDWGEWDASYVAYALVEDGRILANVGVTRMQLIIDGTACSCDQWGAVAVRPECRGRGLARPVLEAALEAAGGRPVLLYANPDVRAFYPRFGFRPAASHRFSLDCRLDPVRDPLATLEVADPAVRAHLHRLAERPPSADRGVSAQAFGRIASWYYANGFARPLRAIEANRWISAEQVGEVLHIDAVFADDPFDLLAALPRLLNTPIQRIEWGFDPAPYLDSAQRRSLRARIEPDADLFLRDFSAWPNRPHGLTPLART